MTYRERRQARADRLRGWAEGNEKKADAAHERVHEIADQIPFGQPILVGHHSERHARRDQARMESGMRSSIDLSRKAQGQSDRADEIERQAANAIYDDDEDAVERLTEKIAKLEGERDRWKAYNASCRKGERDVSLLDEKQQASIATIARVCSYQLGKNGAAPSYELTNLGANIRRLTKRREQLQRGPVVRAPRVIEARYAGECDKCHGPINRGDVIDYTRGEPVVHHTCPEKEA